MKLRKLVVDDAIVTSLVGTKRNEVLAEIMDSLVKAGAVAEEHRDSLLDGVIKREKRGTTGFGHGVAVPHVKTPEVDSLKVAIGISDAGIDFKAFDKEPVHSIFLLISPEDRMAAMQDDHASPNIDLEYCGVDGWRCAEPHQATPQSQGDMYDVD